MCMHYIGDQFGRLVVSLVCIRMVGKAADGGGDRGGGRCAAHPHDAVDDDVR